MAVEACAVAAEGPSDLLLLLESDPGWTSDAAVVAVYGVGQTSLR